MNKAFEKILERLEEERELSYADFSRYVEEVSPCLDAEYDDFFHRGLERASRLVKEVAEEYNNGWIACSGRLPEEYDSIFAKLKGTDKWKDAMFEKTSDVVNVTVVDGYGNRITTIAHLVDGKWNCDLLRINKSYQIIAWQPLPEPFKERD